MHAPMRGNHAEIDRRRHTTVGKVAGGGGEESSVWLNETSISKLTRVVGRGGCGTHFDANGFLKGSPVWKIHLGGDDRARATIMATHTLSSLSCCSSRRGRLGQEVEVDAVAEVHGGGRRRRLAGRRRPRAMSPSCSLAWLV